MTETVRRHVAVHFDGAVADVSTRFGDAVMSKLVSRGERRCAASSTRSSVSTRSSTVRGGTSSTTLSESSYRELLLAALDTSVGPD
jgi:hypothetical protein